MRFINPKTDYAFKKIFSSAQSKNILISFLNALLYEGQNTIRDLEFIDTYEAGSVAVLKDSYLDVRAKLDNGSTVIIEMQVLNIEGLNKRVIYYAAKVYVNQLQRGKIYTGLKPVISLTIADFTIFKKSKKIITRFAFKEWDNSFVYPDSDIELFFVELPKFKKKLANLESITDKWLYFMKHTDSLETVPESMEVVPEISQAFTIANEANLTIDELQQLEKQEQFILDRKGAIAFSKKEGHEEGKREGREEGKKELIISLIERLLGTINVQTQQRLNQLSSRQLEQLSQAMLEFKNMSDLEAWLEQVRDEE